uniref:Uncharacterized protein n=1 Tax=Rhizophora mucronata TaxID=61149 RepID=A0A2P2N1H5_RHIMU
MLQLHPCNQHIIFNLIEICTEPNSFQLHAKYLKTMA